MLPAPVFVGRVVCAMRRESTKDGNGQWMFECLDLRKTQRFFFRKFLIPRLYTACRQCSWISIFEYCSFSLPTRYSETCKTFEPHKISWITLIVVVCIRQTEAKSQNSISRTGVQSTGANFS